MTVDCDTHDTVQAPDLHVCTDLTGMTPMTDNGVTGMTVRRDSSRAQSGPSVTDMTDMTLTPNLIPRGLITMFVYGRDCCRKCGHVFVPEELRYRADDGFDYCTFDTCAVEKWREDMANAQAKSN